MPHSQMGFSFCSLFCILVLAFFFKLRPLASQHDPGVETSQSQLNTDMFFVSEFFRRMGLTFGKSRVHNFSAPVCSWQGVLCDTQNHHVYGLVASGLGLSGAIPDVTIGKLSNLQSLDLSNNKITALPSDLWSLGSLKSLNLSKNIISGSLPNNIGNFGKLESLDLSGNNFSGEVPRALSSLLKLRVLKLNQNGFQWSIPKEILSCQSLVSIDLSSNRLNGSLPDGFGAAFPKLKALILARNEISQVQLNSSTYNRSHLVYLDLSENQLSGEVLHGLSAAQTLKHLNLAHNRFSRHEFPQTEKLLVLEYLNLSKTGLTGHIPNQISQLTHLKTLDLSQNHLSGHVPLMNMESLQVIDLSHNNLSGHIPAPLLEKLPSMRRFDFSYNNLTFCAPEFSQGTIKKAFFGSWNSCPVAANTGQFKRRDSKNKAMKLALALTLSMIILLSALLFLAFGCRRKTKTWAVKKRPSSIKSYREEQSNLGPFSFQTDSTTWVADVKVATAVQVVIFEKPLLNITFADLLSATSNFDRGTLLAEGKFGPVYRGFLPGNIHVAVKVLVHGSTLTEQEAATELENLGRIKHPNLLPLMGYCLAGEKMIAIYEYMENGNLKNFLHDLPLGVVQTETWEESDGNGIENVGSELTSWRFRHKIALGTARALAFLHHGCSPPIIHRGVRASSVYLDYNLEPRLSDFGLAKVVGRGLDDDTAGYVAPELCSETEGVSPSPTPKSDVYCFGVVLLELVTGKKAEESLVSWVRGLVRKNRRSTAVDPKIAERGVEYQVQMEEAIQIGYLCTAELPSKRPSMQQVLGLLKDIEPVLTKD